MDISRLMTGEYPALGGSEGAFSGRKVPNMLEIWGLMGICQGISPQIRRFPTASPRPKLAWC